MSFSFFFADDEVPMFSSGIFVNTEAGVPTAVVTWNEPIVTDNSGLYTVTQDYRSGSNFSIGSTLVTYTAADARGNTAFYSFNVTVMGKFCMISNEFCHASFLIRYHITFQFI